MAKIKVSIPEDLLGVLDKAAREARTSRSAFLAQAVKHYLEEREEKEKRRQAAVAIDRFREKYGGWDGTAEVLKWRDNPALLANRVGATQQDPPSCVSLRWDPCRSAQAMNPPRGFFCTPG